MSPSPLQLLAYYAAKTTRITLGTCVIVLPWYDPGRCMFGRGAASAEYAGFRVPMEEARARFAEAAQLITKALRDAPAGTGALGFPGNRYVRCRDQTNRRIVGAFWKHRSRSMVLTAGKRWSNAAACVCEIRITRARVVV